MAVDHSADRHGYDGAAYSMLHSTLAHRIGIISVRAHSIIAAFFFGWLRAHREFLVLNLRSCSCAPLCSLRVTLTVCCLQDFLIQKWAQCVQRCPLGDVEGLGQAFQNLFRATQLRLMPELWPLSITITIPTSLLSLLCMTLYEATTQINLLVWCELNKIEKNRGNIN